ncbi:Cysteine--tRNA ligase [Gossypium arboreum]|uniref:Cysteine--tRNA ligase n=1 Tax=Gossypium arboreum TaxID=29729 RepID=A0A0B0N1Q0_GOSAR|nr:Cysteine--tRNA ligase [Gossypium arboreum]
MPLPKLPPLLCHRVEEIRRGRKRAVADSGEDLISQNGNSNESNESQKFTSVQRNDSSNNNTRERRTQSLEFGSVDDPLNCPSSPSFRFYITPLVKDKKNDDNCNCKNDLQKKESFSKSDGTDESQTSSEESPTKLKNESKGTKMWFLLPWGKYMKNLIHIKPCC